MIGVPRGCPSLDGHNHVTAHPIIIVVVIIIIMGEKTKPRWNFVTGFSIQIPWAMGALHLITSPTTSSIYIPSFLAS